VLLFFHAKFYDFPKKRWHAFESWTILYFASLQQYTERLLQTGLEEMLLGPETLAAFGKLTSRQLTKGQIVGRTRIVVV
jgi:hypothetical protein